ncbi:hypothetical protein LS70_001120 [Helicobacter sp. MIT 11-5569]|uniref:hypothetical protein n=1 Tax=Helicobacter sp. MIT 11-5569 TaxID=1548151 RepID=UPI00051FB676|nr:hypothetical protein [Helicobacter sp. MIT 11-5569]TLD85181.1 hypothetical protein LS70_001120 [Helicobacter sp. MIT 11-5569]
MRFKCFYHEGDEYICWFGGEIIINEIPNYPNITRKDIFNVVEEIISDQMQKFGLSFYINFILVTFILYPKTAEEKKLVKQEEKLIYDTLSQRFLGKEVAKSIEE